MPRNLQTSGQISLGDIKAEFKGEDQINLGDYYGVDYGVPCPPEKIKVSHFHNAAAAESNIEFGKAGTLDHPAWTTAGGNTNTGIGTGGYLPRNPSGADYFTGDFPVEILPGLEVSTGAGTAPKIYHRQLMSIHMHGTIDHGFFLWMTTHDNPTKASLPYGMSQNGGLPSDWTLIGFAWHKSPGIGYVSSTTFYNLDVPIGKRVRFGYSCGDNYRNYLTSGQIIIKFPNPLKRNC